MAANYYIDLVNGTDGNSGTIHDGKMENNGGANYTAAAGTDATHIHFAQGGFDNDADDNYNGDYLWNVTRSIGAIISDYDADDGGGSSVITVAIAGQAAGDTFYIIRAWKTIEHYTSVAADVREAGDVAYVRANQTETVGAADIVFDEDGTAALPIKVVGCDAVTNDPWGDASNTKPTIDFNGGAYQMLSSGDDWWELERLAIRNGADANGLLDISGSRCWKYKNCKFYDAIGASTYGLRMNGRTQADFDGCDFIDNDGMSLQVGGVARLKDCTFNGGAGGTNYGISIAGGIAFLENCTFGQTTAHNTSDLYPRYGLVYLRNCTLNKLAGAAFDTLGAEVFWEDCEMPNSWASHGHANGAWVVQRETTVVRPGGGSESALILPNALSGASIGGLNCPASLGGQFGLIPSPVLIYLEKDIAYTVTIYIRGSGTWAVPPTSSTLWLQASYYDHAVNKTRAVIKSNDAITNDDSTWAAFDVTFTPLQDGIVYLDVILSAYEAAKGIYVDITPVVTQ